jgi:predicted AlkP superfamily phosphohydrolase/phosphomutase
MSSARPSYKKVAVLGLDGLEPTIVADLLRRGELPNLAKLADAGGLSQVGTTAPAQTPVAWSTFATGLNPGGHGIFDFIRRDPATYQPDLALNRYEQKKGWLSPRAVNLRQGTAVWDQLASVGVRSTILRCPCSYPASLDRGRLLAGMGVPDLRGGLGTSTFYTTDPNVKALEAESVITLDRPASADQPIATRLIGPRNPADRSTITAEISLTVDSAARTVTIRSKGDPAELVVGQGTWSDWLRVRFKAGMLQSPRGMLRFHVVRTEPEIELYASPINFDPALPLFPISAPGTYAEELAEEIGLFHTAGMIEDHAGLSNGRLSEDAFLDQCDQIWNERQAMMIRELDRFDAGLFYCLFDTPDRVQHMFWRFREAGHPANLGQAPDPRHAQVVEDQYRRSDRAVGELLARVDDRTLVIVLSDHGFKSFRRGVQINRWLHQNGLLALKDGARPGDHAEVYPRAIDWSNTRAYAIGLGGIYLNLEGREGQGIVKPGEAEALARSIAQGLTGLADPANGSASIRGVKSRAELYHGPCAGDSPDLVVNFAEGYRVAWESAMGGVTEELFSDNTKKWSGDHIIDPDLVPGVLLMNRPHRGSGARLLDLAPTILDALGQPKGSAMEGETLL